MPVVPSDPSPRAPASPGARPRLAAGTPPGRGARSLVVAAGLPGRDRAGHGVPLGQLAVPDASGHEAQVLASWYVTGRLAGLFGQGALARRRFVRRPGR